MTGKTNYQCKVDLGMNTLTNLFYSFSFLRMLKYNVMKKSKNYFNKYKTKSLSDKKHCIELNQQLFFPLLIIYNTMPYSCNLDLIKYIYYSL